MYPTQDKKDWVDNCLIDRFTDFCFSVCMHIAILVQVITYQYIHHFELCQLKSCAGH